jgi:hypothetical protein
VPLVVPAPLEFEISDARRALKTMLEAIAPHATVHHSWQFRVDTAGRVTNIAALLGKKQTADEKVVHCWMIGVEGDDYVRDAQNNLPIVGADQIEYLYNLAVWGFFDFALGTSTSDSQDIVDRETELAKAIVVLNLKDLGLDNPVGLREVKPLYFPTIDVHPFGDGRDVHVAQGAMQIRIERT